MGHVNLLIDSHLKNLRDVAMSLYNINMDGNVILVAWSTLNLVEIRMRYKVYWEDLKRYALHSIENNMYLYVK